MIISKNNGGVTVGGEHFYKNDIATQKSIVNRERKVLLTQITQGKQNIFNFFKTN